MNLRHFFSGSVKERYELVVSVVEVESAEGFSLVAVKKNIAVIHSVFYGYALNVCFVPEYCFHSVAAVNFFLCRNDSAFWF